MKQVLIAFVFAVVAVKWISTWDPVPIVQISEGKCIKVVPYGSCSALPAKYDEEFVAPQWMRDGK